MIVGLNVNKQNVFLRKNYKNHSIEELTDMYFQEFGKKYDKSTIAEKCRKIGLIRGKGGPGIKRKPRQQNTSQENEWLIENVEKMCFKDLCDSFRTQFNKNIKDDSIRRRLKRNYGKQTRVIYKYTHDQEYFLKNNYGKYKQKELVRIFNEKFQTNYSLSSIINECKKNLKLPTNKYYPIHEIGDETKRKGFWWVKVSDEKGVEFPKNYELKHKIVYEKEYGKIPDGSRIIFLDGNRENFEISNLCLLSRSEFSVIVGNGWINKNEEISLAKVNYAKLRSLLIESEETEC